MSYSSASFTRRHELLAFFALAYGWSWGSYAALRSPVLFPIGPFVAALIVAGVGRGKAGLMDLLGRCLRWRAAPAWYAAAVLVPIGLALAAIALDVALGAPMRDVTRFAAWYSFFAFFPAALIDAPLFEETGWRGFALPKFSESRSALFNTLILGVLVAGWHLPLAFAAGPLLGAYLFAAVASAVMTNWIYYNTGQSALLAMIYHASANAMGGAGFKLFDGPDATRTFSLLALLNGVAATCVVVFTRTFRRKASVPVPTP